MTVAGSIVIIPPLIISSIFGMIWSIFSWVSTAITMTGRSRDSSTDFDPRRMLRAPYPAIPRMTVAPANPSSATPVCDFPPSRVPDASKGGQADTAGGADTERREASRPAAPPKERTPQCPDTARTSPRDSSPDASFSASGDCLPFVSLLPIGLVAGRARQGDDVRGFVVLAGRHRRRGDQKPEDGRYRHDDDDPEKHHPTHPPVSFPAIDHSVLQQEKAQGMPRSTGNISLPDQPVGSREDAPCGRAGDYPAKPCRIF